MWLLSSTALAATFDDYRLGGYYLPADVDEPQVRAAVDAIVDLDYATGFLIGPHHLLTNAHVAEALGSHVRGHLSVSGRPIALDLVASDAEQDVALYRTDADGLEWLEVRVAPLPALGEAVAVLGHPGGHSLRVSFGQVLTESAVVGGVASIEYSAQTWWGSSGSAVIDREGRAIAVHWGWDSEGAYHGRLTGVPLARAAAALPALAQVLLCPDPGALRVTSTLLELGEDVARVRLALDGPEGCLGLVEDAVWHLHPTFEDPDVRARSLQILAWGEFDLGVTVTVAGGTREIAGRAEW